MHTQTAYLELMEKFRGLHATEQQLAELERILDRNAEIAWDCYVLRAGDALEKALAIGISLTARILYSIDKPLSLPMGLLFMGVCYLAKTLGSHLAVREQLPLFFDRKAFEEDYFRDIHDLIEWPRALNAQKGQEWVAGFIRLYGQDLHTLLSISRDSGLAIREKATLLTCAVTAPAALSVSKHASFALLALVQPISLLFLSSFLYQGEMNKRSGNARISFDAGSKQGVAAKDHIYSHRPIYMPARYRPQSYNPAVAGGFGAYQERQRLGLSPDLNAAVPE